MYIILSLQDPERNLKKQNSTQIRIVLNQLKSELKDVYTNPYLLKYEIWFAFATGIYFQVNIWQQYAKYLGGILNTVFGVLYSEYFLMINHILNSTYIKIITYYLNLKNNFKKNKYKWPLQQQQYLISK